jgi:hypothetical protein
MRCSKRFAFVFLFFPVLLSLSIGTFTVRGMDFAPVNGH